MTRFFGTRTFMIGSGSSSRASMPKQRPEYLSGYRMTPPNPTLHRMAAPVRSPANRVPVRAAIGELGARPRRKMRKNENSEPV
jgi:hypothetical protein